MSGDRLTQKERQQVEYWRANAGRASIFAVGDVLAIIDRLAPQPSSLLKLGDTISQVGLAQHLGVHRNTIRRAGSIVRRVHRNEVGAADEVWHRIVSPRGQTLGYRLMRRGSKRWARYS